MVQGKGDQVAYLKKVILVVSGGSTRAEADTSGAHKRVSFIFGLGTGGLSPFEVELSGKGAGDVIYLDMADKNPGQFFGHVFFWFMPDLKILESQVLKVVVEKVEEATQREVVKELAEISEYGHGCSCC